jgi:hypothetical protein
MERVFDSVIDSCKKLNTNCLHHRAPVYECDIALVLSETT